MNTGISGSRPSRRAAAAAGLLVAVVGLTIALIVRRGEKPNGAPETRSVEDVGMAGMDMSTDGSIELSASQIRQFGVTFASAEERPMSDEVRTVGIVAPDETRVAQITLKYGGYVERLYADFTGQPVGRGQPLLEIYSPELVSAQEELLLAARVDRGLSGGSVPGVPANASSLVQAARRRLALWDVPDAEIEELMKTGEVRRTLTVRSPVSGIVVDKSVLSGQAVQAGQTLYTVADLSRVWVEAELRESDAGTVREGSAATVELGAFPGRAFQGRVDYVYPTVQPQARTLKARVTLANPGGLLKPGMYATVRFATPSRTVLTVPSAAIVDTGVRRIVFVDLGGGQVAPQEVTPGRVAGDLTEIVSGLFPGQRVVTSAQYLLDSESNLGEVMRSMIGQGAGDMGSMDMGEKGADTKDMPGMDMPPKGR